MESNMDKLGKEQEEALKKLYAFVIEQMKAGADKYAILQKLVEMGADKTVASEMVEKIYDQIVKAAEEEQFSENSLFPALVGGILAAVIGGIIWGGMVVITGYEAGFIAWGIGWLTGVAVVKFSNGKKGVPLQVIATLSSVLGIIIGKYITFFLFLQVAVAKKYGAVAASYISIFSGRVIQLFFDKIELVMSGYDILWFILAVITAWRIPKARLSLFLQNKSTNNAVE